MKYYLGLDRRIRNEYGDFIGWLKKCKDGIFLDTFDFLGDEMDQEEIDDIMLQYENNKNLFEW